VLPQDTILGRLTIVQVFDYYDGPKLFSARNAVGTMFLVYWADRDDVSDVWFYVPISLARLDAVCSGDVTLRDAIVKPEERFLFEVTESRLDESAVASQIFPENIDVSRLPPLGDTIEVGEDTSPSFDRANPAFHDLAIGRGTRRGPRAESVASVLTHWSSLLMSATLSLGQRARFFAVGASPGSFIITLAEAGGLRPDEALAKLKALLENLETGEKRAEMIVRSSAINPRHLENFLATLVDNRTSAEILTVDATGAKRTIFEVDSTRAATILRAIKDLSISAVTSDEIPQADRLDTVFKAVVLAVKGRQLTPQSLGIVPRQVNYYRHAARVLGFFDHENLPTPLGERLVAEHDSSRLEIAEQAFHRTRCGWAWLHWSKCTSLRDIDPESAAKFLAETAFGLNETTQKRRATSLKAWIYAFKERGQE